MIELDEKEAKRALGEYARDEGLMKQLPGAAIAGFGAVPLGRVGGSFRMACLRQIHPDALKLLERAIGFPVEPVYCPDRVLGQFIYEVCLSKGSVNFNTFTDPDFLLREESIPSLLSEKVDSLGTISVELPPDRVALLETRFHSRLENIDLPSEACGRLGGPPDRGKVPWETGFSQGELQVPLRLVDGRPVLSGEKPLDPETFVYHLHCSRYDGVEHFHGVGGEEVRKLPLAIHPTEIQITRVGPLGEICFYLYDRFEQVAPETLACLECDYYFLSYGMRYFRRLRLWVEGLRLFDRSDFSCGGKDDRWTPQELARWFGERS